MQKEEPSGLDELMALSRKFSKQQEEHDKQERQRQEQGKKVKGVLQGLQNLNLTMALDQLKTVAKPDIVRQVSLMKGTGDTNSLRKIITAVVDDLEKQLITLPAPKANAASPANAARTLSILLDLYFSLH